MADHHRTSRLLCHGPMHAASSYDELVKWSLADLRESELGQRGEETSASPATSTPTYLFAPVRLPTDNCVNYQSTWEDDFVVQLQRLSITQSTVIL
jgi:hypothetical protein